MSFILIKILCSPPCISRLEEKMRLCVALMVGNAIETGKSVFLSMGHRMALLLQILPGVIL